MKRITIIIMSFFMMLLSQCGHQTSSEVSDTQWVSKTTDKLFAIHLSEKSLQSILPYMKNVAQKESKDVGYGATAHINVDTSISPFIELIPSQNNIMFQVSAEMNASTIAKIDGALQSNIASGSGVYTGLVSSQVSINEQAFDFSTPTFRELVNADNTRNESYKSNSYFTGKSAANGLTADVGNEVLKEMKPLAIETLEDELNAYKKSTIGRHADDSVGFLTDTFDKLDLGSISARPHFQTTESHASIMVQVPNAQIERNRISHANHDVSIEINDVLISEYMKQNIIKHDFVDMNYFLNIFAGTPLKEANKDYGKDNFPQFKFDQGESINVYFENNHLSIRVQATLKFTKDSEAYPIQITLQYKNTKKRDGNVEYYALERLPVSVVDGRANPTVLKPTQMQIGLSGISSFFAKTAEELGEYNETKMIESFLNSFLKDETILHPWITMNVERKEFMTLDAFNSENGWLYLGWNVQSQANLANQNR